MRRLTTLLIALPLLGSACLKPAEVRKAAQPTNVAVVYALGSIQSAEIQAMPDAVQTRVQAELEARNLVPAMLPAPEAFASVRTAKDRLDAVAGATSPVLLVACDPVFDTQVNGRYRWTVACDVGIGKELSHFEPSAHLVYYHQDESDAVVEVQTQIAREVAQVVDRWLVSPPR